MTNDDLASLYVRYGVFLRKRCLLLVRDPALAEDALQDAFVKVLRSDEQLAQIEEPLRWLYRIVHRTCLDALRRRRIRVADEFEESKAPHSPNAAVEERDWAVRFLHTLDRESQEIAIYAFVEGMSQSEIAEELGYSRVTVNKRVMSLKAQAQTWSQSS
jgi:RNA polymerase sigma-70 factor, ECF subfamily